MVRLYVQSTAVRDWRGIRCSEGFTMFDPKAVLAHFADDSDPEHKRVSRAFKRAARALFAQARIDGCPPIVVGDYFMVAEKPVGDPDPDAN